MDTDNVLVGWYWVMMLWVVVEVKGRHRVAQCTGGLGGNAFFFILPCQLLSSPYPIWP